VGITVNDTVDADSPPVSSHFRTVSVVCEMSLKAQESFQALSGKYNSRMLSDKKRRRVQPSMMLFLYL
jgi:hypothetical protein